MSSGSKFTFPVEALKYDSQGLIPCIAQDHQTGEVLMLAYMNEESLHKTVETGCAVYWTRSRQKLWKKGEESGNVQVVKDIFFDCDNDTIVIKIDQIGGAACHTGHRSCFFKQLNSDGTFTEIGEKVFDPKKVYNK